MKSNKRDPKGTIPVNVKLTVTEKLAIDVLCQEGRYDSRSGAIRAGLGLLFSHHKLDKSFDRAIEQERSIHTPRRRKLK